MKKKKCRKTMVATLLATSMVVSCVESNASSLNTEVEIEGFSALTPDGKIKISLLPEIYLKGLKNEGAKERFEDLMALFKDGTYTFHTDITPIHKYGLDGYSLVSSSEHVQNYDEHFDLPEIVDGIYQIRIGVTASDGVTIEEALENSLVRDFIDSIKSEEYTEQSEESR